MTGDTNPRIPTAATMQEEYIKTFHPVSEGQMVSGVVVEVGQEYIFVDIGLKSEGRIPSVEFPTPPKIGDRVYVILVKREGYGGAAIVSKKRADEKLFWKLILEAHEEHKAVEGIIDTKIKGGFEVDLGNGIRAFLPLSKTDIARVREPDDYLNLKSSFYIERLYSKGKVNIVVSRKDWLEVEVRRKREEFFRTAQIGDEFEGLVKSFTSYGAFIDLGGFDGLLHINDMRWGHVNTPKDVVDLGQTIRVKVIHIDPQENRINLSLKHFTEDPWNHFEEKYHAEDVVPGTVTKLTDFGAFIEIEEGIEGLAHISELSWVKKVKHPRDLLKPGDQVEVKVLGYDIAEGRLSLGLKQVKPNPWDSIADRYPVGMRMKRVVKNLTNFGAFVELEEGIDGLLHVDDLSWTKKVRHPSAVVNQGDEIEVMVIEIDSENRRIKLGTKQLSEDPWQSLAKAYPKGAIVEGEISNITDFGFFLKVQGEIEGLVSKSNLYDPEETDYEAFCARYKVGDKLKCVVTEISAQRQKLSLSLREHQRRLQREDLDKYIHNEDTEETATLGDFLKEKSQS